LLTLLALANPARAAMRSDSTVADAWRLENGLEVRTLHVPNASGVAVTLAFRAGSGYEPAGQAGLSELLAELQFMGAAGDIPARTRTEMASLRPLGWESRPGSRLARFTEIASKAQLPGVLQQAAKRLAGVSVTDEDLKSALASVRRDAAGHLFGLTSNVLYWRSALLARGLDDEEIVRRANMKDLDRLKPKDVTPLLARWYNPGNASLALVGDLSGIDVHALVKSLFAPLPGGPALPDTVQVRFRGGSHTASWKEIGEPVGVVAVEAPALSDTLHPAFYPGVLITGTGVIDAGARPSHRSCPASSTLFDDPSWCASIPRRPSN
jgi:zinc protease